MRLPPKNRKVVTIMEELFSFETSMERIMKSEREEARAEGRAEGANQKAEKTALFLLGKNIDIPTIMGATELTEDRIKEIAVDHGLIQ
jgi:hypothetical protein